MKEKMEQTGFVKGVLLVLFLGFLIGIGIFFGFRELLAEHIAVFYDTLISNLTEYELEQEILFKKIITKNVQSFFLMALFGISILGIPYIICFLISKGILGGFLLGSMLLRFGGKGILAGILYGFPQMIFYAPVMYAMMHKSYYMGVNGLKKKLLWEQVPSVFILLGILLVGCFLEAYVNSWILKKVLIGFT